MLYGDTRLVFRGPSSSLISKPGTSSYNSSVSRNSYVCQGLPEQLYGSSGPSGQAKRISKPFGGMVPSVTPSTQHSIECITHCVPLDEGMMQHASLVFSGFAAGASPLAEIIHSMMPSIIWRRRVVPGQTQKKQRKRVASFPHLMVHSA